MNRIHALAILLPVAAATAAPLHVYEIPNDLRLAWPSDLVSLPAPAGVRLPAPERLGLTVEGATRPVQTERTADGAIRLWSVVTAVSKPDTDDRGRDVHASDIRAELAEVSAPFPEEARIRLREERDAFTIANGLYEFRLRRYPGRLPAPVALQDLPHWIAGMRPAGAEPWDGAAAFAGDARVVRAETEILAAGPVFVDARVRLVFEGSEKPAGEPVPALPLASGKQTHRWAPGEIPLRDAPRLERSYEARIRFVWNDPWIDVDERYRLPGGHRYRVAWGGDGAAALDTVTWVRWFEWDEFGGNIDQKWVPAAPRPAQKGRPFALLRPAWNQGGAGAQDFFLTRGGADGAANAGAPMFGVVAAFASKWVAPYAQTISAEALDGRRGHCDFPLGDGGEAGAWYAQRAYGLCCAPRGAYPSLNNLVRRHTDWTLDAQANRYVLRWPGRAEKPSAKAPTCELYLQRRYQDDFLNPTQRMTRSLKQFDTVRPGTCGAAHAALGYIFTDPDHWPGWNSGWRPGNPNFHTDKYMGTIYIASAMPDHPDAKNWLAYGLRNYLDDLGRVFQGPDAVGAECPGYAGYSTGLQADVALSLLRQGVPAEQVVVPAFAKSARWHRKLLTPVDPRLGFRHEAPHGDTHRWISGVGATYGKLALLLRASDPAAAAECRAAGEELARTGGLKTADWESLLDRGLRDVPAADFAALDWSSQAFEGFGAVLRDAFGTPAESFVSVKAGAIGGHYHHDDLAFHAYLDGRPASLDYNCSYHPRGDHAALHNAPTFGAAGTLVHHGRGGEVEALEQPVERAGATRFLPGARADVFVAERDVTRLVLAPVFPKDAEFNRDYPSRAIDPIRHRRTLALVKPAPGSKIPAYLVVRDEIDGAEPVQLNLHLLARDLRRDGDAPLFRARGQLDRDLSVFVARAPIESAELRRWSYFADDKPSVPSPMPPEGWTGEWRHGEEQQWLRLHFAPRTDAACVLFAHDPAFPPPAFEELPDGRGVRVAYRGQTDEIRFEEDGSVSVR